MSEKMIPVFCVAFTDPETDRTVVSYFRHSPTPYDVAVLQLLWFDSQAEAKAAMADMAAMLSNGGGFVGAPS